MKGYPIRFAPIYKERIWGGRALERVYGRILPGTVPVGESWEVTDRPEGTSVVTNGSWAGRTLSELLTAEGPAILGTAATRSGRFPLLVKVLDARQVLSLQVHPPDRIAGALGGESKTELWYFTATEPGAEILVGLKPGTTREAFERAIPSGAVADCFHRVPVSRGDAMYLPSGRVHALGAGVLLFEIQENSDTTYRVYDWNRPGLDGRPRALQVPESLASIDFSDFAPGLVASPWVREGDVEVRRLVAGPPFGVDTFRASAGVRREDRSDRCRVLGVVRGKVRVGADDGGLEEVLGPGDFALLPADLRAAWVRVESAGGAGAEWLVATPGTGGS
ncbi:MAG: class I mannose-6-phosphate isomerase [Verrucomicrobiales bacterium]|nr:class I mannose-6-phosphate isomerase [Verrucomicrobiales bacterium]